MNEAHLNYTIKISSIYMFTIDIFLYMYLGGIFLCQNDLVLSNMHLARDSENTSCLSHFISTCSSGYEYMRIKYLAYLQPDLVFKLLTSLQLESMEDTT